MNPRDPINRPTLTGTVAFDDFANGTGTVQWQQDGSSFTQTVVYNGWAADTVAVALAHDDPQLPVPLRARPVNQGWNNIMSVVTGGINPYPDEWNYGHGGAGGLGGTVLIGSGTNSVGPLTYVQRAGAQTINYIGGPGTFDATHRGVLQPRGCHLGIVYGRIGLFGNSSSDTTIWVCGGLGSEFGQFDLQFGNLASHVQGMAAVNVYTDSLGNIVPVFQPGNTTITGTNIACVDGGAFYVINYVNPPLFGGATFPGNVGTITQYTGTEGFGTGDFPIGDPLFYTDGTSIYQLVGNNLDGNFKINQYDYMANLLVVNDLDFSTTAASSVLVVWTEDAGQNNGHAGNLPDGDHPSGLLLLQVSIMTGNVTVNHDWLVPIPTKGADFAGNPNVPFAPNNVTLAWDPVTQANAWKHEGGSNASPPYSSFIPYMVVKDRVFCLYTKQYGVTSAHTNPEGAPNYDADWRAFSGLGPAFIGSQSVIESILTGFGNHTVTGFLPTTNEVGIAYLDGVTGNVTNTTSSPVSVALTGAEYTYIGGSVGFNLVGTTASLVVQGRSGSTPPQFGPSTPMPATGFLIPSGDLVMSTTRAIDATTGNQTEYFFGISTVGLGPPPPILPPETVDGSWTALEVAAPPANVTLTIPETSRNPNIYSTDGNLIFRSFAAQPIDPVTGNSTTQQIMVYSAADLSFQGNISIPATPTPVTLTDAQQQPYPGNYKINIPFVGTETIYGQPAVIKLVVRQDGTVYFAQSCGNLSDVEWYTLNIGLRRVTTSNLWLPVSGDVTPSPVLLLGNGNHLIGWTNPQDIGGGGPALHGGGSIIQLDTAP